MNCKHQREGMSLLELMIATAIMAAIVTAAAGLLRTSQTVWNTYNGDVAKLDAAHAVLRHLVRELRQCWSISAITAAGNTNGSLSAVDGDGLTHVWTKSGSNVNYGISSANHLLATDLSQLTFVGYQGDGTTTTTVVAEIRSVQCSAVVQLDRATNATKTIRCRAWLRAW
jgi:prepilin-type N-terminal cleavage/methylation domain-containing protein